MRKRIDPKAREEPRFPTISCPWCDTPIGLWEEGREDGIWNGRVRDVVSMAAFFAPLSLDTRVFLA